MRTIKFRGKRVDTGEFVFGDVAHTELGILMGYGFEVVSDSVAQFVGCDLDGAEVYEGDIVTDGRGREFVAKLMPVGERSSKYVTTVKFAMNTLKLKTGENNAQD